MKKQILFLAMFTLALIFAGINKSYGQTYIKHVEGPAACAPAIALGCAGTSGALNPTPGQIYNYSITTDPAAVDNVLWYVTDASAVMAAGTLTPLASRDPGNGTGTYVLLGEAGVYNTAGPAKDIDISWQWFDGGAAEVLLVAYVTGASGCSDEVEVWRIQPSFSFTLDVLSMAPNGSLGSIATPASECVSPVENATFVAGATPAADRLTMDYGENWVFFSVNAANFADSWMPALSATITSGGTVSSTIGAVEWAYADQAILPAGTWNATTVAVDASAAALNGVVGAAGECIVVRVEIQHGNNPTPFAANTETVTLSVNGIMYDAADGAKNYTNTALTDVDEVAGSCVQNVTDTGTYTLLARPALTAVAPSPFVTKN